MFGLNLQKYPTHAFSGLAAELNTAGINAGVAPSIMGGFVQGAKTLLTAPRVDVSWPNGQIIPAGSNCVMIARSGGGKSVASRYIFDPIREAIAALEGDILATLLMDDPTPEGIPLALEELPWLMLLTDEAGMNLPLRRGKALMAKLLDGTSLAKYRATTGLQRLAGYGFAVNVALQDDEIFAQSVYYPGASSVGLHNRLLYARPFGYLHLNNIHALRMSADLRGRYDDVIKHMLGETIRIVVKKEAKRRVVTLGQDAAQFLIGLRTRDYGTDDPMAVAYLQRESERLLRMVATSHALEHDPEQPVSLEQIERDYAFINWYNAEFQALAYQPPKVSQVEEDARLLQKVIWDVFYNTGITQFVMAEMRRHAMNFGFTAARFTRAITKLANKGVLTIGTYRKAPSFWLPISQEERSRVMSMLPY